MDKWKNKNALWLKYIIYKISIKIKKFFDTILRNYTAKLDKPGFGV